VISLVNFSDPGTPGTVTHTTVTNNIVAESSFHGIEVVTGDTPRARSCPHGTQPNLVVQNTFDRHPRLGQPLLPPGPTPGITQTTLTDNEVRGNGFAGIE